MSSIPWDAAALIAGAVGTWSAALIAIIKWFLNRYHEDTKDRFRRLGEQIAGQTAELHRIDKEILGLRAEMLRDYVRREDSIREQVVINAKLDAVAAKVDTLSANLRINHASTS